MKKTNSKSSHRAVVLKKRTSQVVAGRKKVCYDSVTQSNFNGYSKAVSFLHDLEEQEIEMMVASSTKVSSYTKK